MRDFFRISKDQQTRRHAVKQTMIKTFKQHVLNNIFFR